MGEEKEREREREKKKREREIKKERGWVRLCDVFYTSNQV